MSRFIGALGIAAVTALVAAIVALLIAVVLIGGDEAVFGALEFASAMGLLALPIAWWLLGSRLRDAPDGTVHARSSKRRDANAVRRGVG